MQRITDIQLDKCLFSGKDKIARLESLYTTIDKIKITYVTPATVFSQALLEWKTQKIDGKENSVAIAQNRGFFSWLLQLITGKQKTESSKIIDKCNALATQLNTHRLFQPVVVDQTQDRLPPSYDATPIIANVK